MEVKLYPGFWRKLWIVNHFRRHPEHQPSGWSGGILFCYTCTPYDRHAIWESMPRWSVKAKAVYNSHEIKISRKEADIMHVIEIERWHNDYKAYGDHFRSIEAHRN